MTTIVFHGLLAKKFGEKVKVRLGRLCDFVPAVDAIKTGFRDFLLKLNKNNQDYTVHLEKNGTEIHLVPSIVGAGKTVMIIIAVIIIIICIIVAWYLAPYIGSSGASFLGTLTGTAGGFSSAAAVGSMAVGIAFSVGVSLLMTALTMPSAPGSNDASGQAAMASSGGSTSTVDSAAKSYVFDNLQNDASQGQPIPIGYGRMKIGSNVIHVSRSVYSLDQLFDNEIAPKNVLATIYD
jgi:predicted phage tail protein